MTKRSASTLILGASNVDSPTASISLPTDTLLATTPCPATNASSGTLAPDRIDAAQDSTIESGLPAVDSASPGKRRIRLPISAGAASDHVGLRYFLSDVFGGQCQSAFQASLEDPLYEPNQRLVLRRQGRIVGHAQITERAMQLGDLSVPVAGLSLLGIAQDCHLYGLGSYLLAAAENQMAQSGALIGLLRTNIPHFFRRSGWALCGRNAVAAAPAHALMATLAGDASGTRRQSRIQIRPLRRWEEEPLARIYRQNLRGSFGPLDRSRAIWHWLLERRAYDQLYVALDGPDLADFNESTTRLVGYAAICGDRIVELMTSPGHEYAGDELLARICADAVEQDRHNVVLHADPHSLLLAKVRLAGGQELVDDCESGEVSMARLLDPLAVLRVLCPQFACRALNAGLPLQVELGLMVEGQKFRIDIGEQGTFVSADHVGRCYIKLNVADFTRMTLGQLDWQIALRDGRVAASTVFAREIASVLFPEHPFWRPRLDEVFPESFQ